MLYNHILGSGKSTLMRLLYRFYDCTDGRITLDDQDIRHVSLLSLRQKIAVVPQDTILFNETLRYNIAYGNLALGESQPMAVEAAARDAQLESLIQRLPLGYDTIVGERGE